RGARGGVAGAGRCVPATRQSRVAWRALASAARPHSFSAAVMSAADRPRPRCEQVVLLGADPDRPEYLLSMTVGAVADPRQQARVVAGVAGAPPLSLAGLVESLL